VVAVALAVMASALLAIEFGFVSHEAVLQGPFASPDNSGLLSVRIEAGNPILVARGDSAQAPAASSLRLSVNGHRYSTRHAQHAEIRAGVPEAFSHWRRQVYFSLPEGVANGPETELRLSYPLQFAKPWVTIAALSLLVSVWLAIERPWLADHAWAVAGAVGAVANRSMAWLRRRRRTVAVALASLALITLAGEAGLISHDETLRGPFEGEAGYRTLSVRIKGLSPMLLPRGDQVDAPTRSSLRIWVDGQEQSVPHAQIHDIRLGEQGRFVHWQSRVYFSLPDGGANTERTELRVRYLVQLASPGATFRFVLLLLAAWVAVEWPWLSRSRFMPLLLLPARTALICIWAAFAIALAYGAITAWAWMSGWALPNTAAIRLLPFIPSLAALLPVAPLCLLAFAAIGGLAGLVSVLFRFDQTEILACEERASRALCRFGLPIGLAFALFSASVVWAGMPSVSLGTVMGLVPFSDAAGYFNESGRTVETGNFLYFGGRRPLAQALRSTLYVLSGCSYSSTVILQICLVALAAFLAMVTIVRWRGMWAGLAFSAMCFAAGNQFFLSFLTEPLGLFWGLLSIAGLVTAWRTRSLGYGLLCFGLLSVGLSTRMGSMFTLPALLPWLAFQFGASWRSRAICGGLGALILFGVFLVNIGTGKFYAIDPANIGSNFAYTACGLSIGETWDVCQERYRDEIRPLPTEMAVIDFMYRKALENIADHPTVLLNRLADGAEEFVETLPLTLTQGYLGGSDVDDQLKAAFWAIALIGLVSFARHASRGERLFWVLFWLSVIASSGFVYFDDGKRTMMVIYPLAALYFASSLSRPALASPSYRRPVPIGAAAAAAGLVLAWAILTPAVAHALRPRELSRQWDERKDEHIVYGGSRMGGVLVVADDAPLPTDVASVHLSDFRAAVASSGVELYQNLVTPEPPPLPFGFVATITRGVKFTTDVLFIVPPDVMFRRDVTTWRFQLQEFGRKKPYASYWYLVTKAEPVLF
jgi:hypothetical protein